MTNNHATDFGDILDGTIDLGDAPILRELQCHYAPGAVPPELRAQIAASTKHHLTSQHRGPASLSTRTTAWRRPRVFIAALVIAAAATGVSTSGLAAATIHTLQTRLFSSPPPSPEAALWVGSFVPPLWGGCAPHPTTAPVIAADGRLIAQLRAAPTGFTDSVAVTLPPCWPRPLRPGVVLPKQPANFEWENIKVVSVVRYTGAHGQIEVDTGKTTAEAMRRGLFLGNSAGTLSDGTRLFDMLCTQGCPHVHNLRWLQDGLIVNISGDVSLDQLKALAADAVVR